MSKIISIKCKMLYKFNANSLTYKKKEPNLFFNAFIYFLCKISPTCDVFKRPSAFVESKVRYLHQYRSNLYECKLSLIQQASNTLKSAKKQSQKKSKPF